MGAEAQVPGKLFWNPRSSQPEGGSGREVVFITLIPLVGTESCGHTQLQGRLGNVVLLSMQPGAQLKRGKGYGISRGVYHTYASSLFLNSGDLQSPFPATALARLPQPRGPEDITFLSLDVRQALSQWDVPQWQGRLQGAHQEGGREGAATSGQGSPHCIPHPPSHHPLFSPLHAW